MEKGHGRIETRAVVSQAVKPGELPFPHVAQVARIDRRREHQDGKIEEETVYVVSSRSLGELDAKALGAVVRAHWGIENGLHHRRDRTYQEDDHQVQRHGTAQVMATMRNLAITVRKRLEPKCKRKRDRTLPQMHRHLITRLYLILPLLTKPWS